MIRDMRQTYDTNPKQLQVQVAQAMPVLKAPFFQKVEQMANAATDEVEKAKIVAFGDAVLNNMKEIVGVAQGKMNEQSTMIQGLIGICAEVRLNCCALLPCSTLSHQPFVCSVFEAKCPPFLISDLVVIAASCLSWQGG